MKAASSYNGKRFTFCGIRGGVQKKDFFWGDLSQMCLPSTHSPTQGFLRDLGKRKVKFGSKNGDFRGDFGAGLGKFPPPQKKRFYFFEAPLIHQYDLEMSELLFKVVIYASHSTLQYTGCIFGLYTDTAQISSIRQGPKTFK